MLAEAAQDDPGQCQRPPAARRLRLHQHLSRRLVRLELDPLQGMAHRQRAALQVDVLPAEAERLTLAQPEPESDRVERLQAVAADGVEEDSGLHRVQDVVLEALGLGGVRKRCDVSAQHSPTDGLGQRRPEHGPDVVAGARR